MLIPDLKPRSIAVLRALQLGDMLCAVPALRALRAAAPAARVTLIGLPWAREFARRFRALVDDFLELPGWPGLPEREPDAAAIPGFLREAQARRFDLAVQMHGSGSYVNTLTVLLGARRSAGFFEPGGWNPDVSSFLPYPAEGPEVRRLQLLAESLGAPGLDGRLTFPLGAADEAERRALGAASGEYACVHPGARWPSRRWPAERFAAVADALSARGLRVVLTGARSERALTAEVARRMRATAFDAAGRTSLGGLAALLRRARLLVCNDTGVSHLAAALRTRSVVVASGSDVRRWAPADAARHRVISADMDCRPCGFRECPIGHPCATDVEAGRVAREALALAEAA